MKNVAILAVVLGFFSIAANADEPPNLTLAMNSSPVVSWSKPASAINSDALAELVNLKIAKSAELISIGMEKQLEEKIAKELEYAAQ
ncbi:MAG: hypothetical protein V7459_14865 [Oceanicoccus sp.]